MRNRLIRKQENQSAKTVPIIWLTLVTLTAAACGGGSADTTDTTTPVVTEVTTEETVVGGDDPGGLMRWGSHDEIVAAAEAETGEFKVYLSTQEESIAELQALFEEQYPFVDISITEQSGSDAQRILLETEAGVNDYDVLYLSQEVYAAFLPYLEQIDLLSMAEEGVIAMPTGMVNPNHPYTMAAGSGMAAVAYNPNLLDAELVPQTWEDYLDPALKGRVFLADIEPVNLVTLIPAWGEERVLEFAAAVLEQEPVWARGETNALTTMAAGEHALHFMSNYHSAFRAMGRAPDALAIQIVEPIPVRLTQAQGVRTDSDNPATAVLFLEMLASPEGQTIFDDLEPRQSSIYAEGSEVNKIIEGREISLWDWEYFDKMQGYLDSVLATWGFPTAEVTSD